MKLILLSVQDFVGRLAEGTPVPGGGSAGALCGALGAALCSMVSNVTLGRETFKPAWEEMEYIGNEAKALARLYLDLVDGDAAAYSEVIAAARLPQKTKEEKGARLSALEEAYKRAALVPMESLRAVEKLMSLATSATERGNPNALTDAETALHFARAAAAVAVANVRVNLRSIEDETFVGECRRELSEIMKRVNLIYEEATLHLDLHLG